MSVEFVPRSVGTVAGNSVWWDAIQLCSCRCMVCGTCVMSLHVSKLTSEV